MEVMISSTTRKYCPNKRQPHLLTYFLNLTFPGHATCAKCTLPFKSLQVIYRQRGQNCTQSFEVAEVRASDMTLSDKGQGRQLKCTGLVQQTYG